MRNSLAASYRKFRALTLLTALLAVIFTVGCFENQTVGLGAIFTVIAYGAVFVAAGYLIGARKKWLLIYLAFAVVSMVANLMSTTLPEVQAIVIIDFLSSLCMHSMFLSLIFKFALYDRDANQLDRVIAGVCGYLIIGLFWYNLYNLHEVLSPGGFTTGNGTAVGLGDGSFMYYSLVTLSTVGYGDITPVTHTARLISSMEGVTGTLYLAVFISTLVSAFRKH